MNPPPEKEGVEKLVALLLVDYDQTLKVVDGFVRVSTNIRALAITVWVGLLAASIQTERNELSFLAAGAIAIFAILDAYHGWLYKQASQRAYNMEKLLDRYYKHLYRGDRDGRLPGLRKDLHNHRFGQLSHIPKLSKSFYFQAKPVFFYRVLYPAFLAAALIIGCAVSEAGAEDSSPGSGTVPSYDAQHSPPRAPSAHRASPR